MGTNSNSESRVASTNGCTEVMAASKNENDSSAVRQGEKTEQLIPADNDEKANSSLTKTKIRSIKKTMKKVNGECGKVYFVKDDEENLKLYVDAPVPNRNHELSQRIELYKSAFTTKPGPTIQQEKDLAKAILQDFGRCSFFITPNSNGNNKISSIPTAEITMFLRRTLAAKGSHTTIKCDSENVDATLLKVGAKKKDSHPNNTLEQDCALAAAKALLSVASSGGNSSPSLVASDSFAVRHGSEANNPSVTSAHVAGADSLEAPGKRKWAIHASSSTAPSAGGYYTIDTGANDRDVDSGTGDKRARQERTRVSSAIATPGNKASDLLNKNADFHPDIEDHQRRMLLAQIQANSNILGTTGLHTTYDSRHLRGAGMLDYKTLVDAAASGGTDVMGNSQELVLSMKAIQRSLLQERALKIAAQHQQELLIEQQVAAQRQNLLLEQRVVASLLGTPDAPARHQELMMLLAVQQQQQRSALMQEQRLAALLAAQNNAAPMKKEQGISHVQKKGPSTKTYEPSDAVKAAAAAIAAVTANSTPSDSANPILTFRKQGLGTHSKFASRKQKECNDKDLVPSMTEQAASHEATKKSELSKDEDIEDDEDEISCVELDSESEEELEDEDEDEDNDGVEDEKAEKAYVDDDNKSTKIKEACTVVNSEHTENALQIGGIRKRVDSQMAKKSNTKNKASAIHEPRPADVLCGRGKAKFVHEGNENLRLLITSWVPQYKKTTTKKQKMKITELLTRSVIQSGGRFLIIDPETDRWVDGGYDIGRRKCASAIQDAIRKGTHCYKHENMIVRTAARKKQLSQPASTVTEKPALSFHQLPSNQFLQQPRPRQLENAELLQELLRGRAAAAASIGLRKNNFLDLGAFLR